MNQEVVFPHLGIEIENLPRVAFKLFGINVYLYGLFIALGVLLGILYVYNEAKRTGQNPETYMDFLTFALVIGIIGARIYYVIFSWDLYKDDITKIFAFREGGLAIYGGIIAATITAFFYSRHKGIGFRLFMDTTIIAIPIGQAFGRWGNFFNREVFGGYTDSIFAMRYLMSEVGYLPEKVLEKLVVEDSGVQYIQVHPTFLYEFILCVFIFIFLNTYKKHKKFDGEICALYFVIYGFGRFFIETIRIDQLIIWNTRLPVSAVLSLILFVFGIIFLVYNRIKIAKKI